MGFVDPLLRKLDHSNRLRIRERGRASKSSSLEFKCPGMLETVVSDYLISKLTPVSRCETQTGRPVRNSHRQAGTKLMQASRCENRTGKPVRKSLRQAGVQARNSKCRQHACRFEHECEAIECCPSARRQIVLLTSSSDRSVEAS